MLVMYLICPAIAEQALCGKLYSVEGLAGVAVSFCPPKNLLQLCATTNLETLAKQLSGETSPVQNLPDLLTCP